MDDIPFLSGKNGVGEGVAPLVELKSPGIVRDIPDENQILQGQVFPFEAVGAAEWNFPAAFLEKKGLEPRDVGLERRRINDQQPGWIDGDGKNPAAHRLGKSVGIERAFGIPGVKIVSGDQEENGGGLENRLQAFRADFHQGLLGLISNEGTRAPSLSSIIFVNFSKSRNRRKYSLKDKRRNGRSRIRRRGLSFSAPRFIQESPDRRERRSGCSGTLARSRENHLA